MADTLTYSSAVIPSALSELESAKLDAAKSKVEAHNSQVAALQANLRLLYSGADALQQRFNALVVEIGQAHPDLVFDRQNGVFVPKPVEAPQAAAASTTVQ